MNSPRCRVGDLCIVIQAVHPSNLGHIVRVLAPYDPQGCDLDMAEADWFVESSQPLTWSRGDRHFWLRRRGPVPDEYLQPLRAVTPRGRGSTVTALIRRFRLAGQTSPGEVA